ncbi:hypothetical protein L198_06350 [Cryptococcus wingfieldii CBS 7118]|uniref:Uncharacterized protein n=1 Tax=Cryptococcus wingfieldii CBS 7118 TaxID=1295528 RepID=A0A1E3IM49_9TREE|nr:hypothetical protein L198_06350 [Cryptococcus wingfieldii CBS 7118]ODN89662.1 hypothetical protein L198_06350 [Cryptococcus wingfieldii CBS 7118]
MTAGHKSKQSKRLSFQKTLLLFATLRSDSVDMGYTILLQWSFSIPAGRPTTLADIVSARVLEIYGHSTPTRSAIQLRTYRAQFPSSDIDPTQVSRYLTVMSPIQPPVPSSQAKPRDVNHVDDTAFLFMDDKSAGGTTALEAPGDTAVNESSKSKQRFQCIAVRPVSHVPPMLQSLLSPFVLGLTKAARTTASQTSSTPVPTPLPGSTFAVTSFTFPPLPSSSPSVTLRLHILPQTAGSIFLEGEHIGPSDGKTMEEIKKEIRDFLNQCVLEDTGEKKWKDCHEGTETRGLEGVERAKRTMSSLAQMLRRGSFI